MTCSVRLLLLACVLLAPACRRDAAAASQGPGQPAAHEHDQEHAPTNRIDVPPQVRQNLGITFVKVERRRIASSLRVPGHFAAEPGARREYRPQVGGRVQLATQALRPVRSGDLLFTVDAPAWRQAQRELGELSAAITLAQARHDSMQPLRAAHERHETSLDKAIEVAAHRLAELEALHADVGGQAADLAQLRLKLAELRAELAEVQEKDAELTASASEAAAALAAARERFDASLAAAAALLGTSAAELAVAGAAGQPPRWRAIDRLEVRAVADGVVEPFAVADGGTVDAFGLVLATTDPRRVRFTARALQSDLLRVADGQPVRLSRAGAAPSEPPLAGVLQLGLVADPEQRTLELWVTPDAVPAWARPGIAGFAEIETASGGANELAVPSASVLTDGLQRVLFRRDPRDPDRVIRETADLGLDDGRWIEVRSGLADGEEVVLGGAYELMLASSGSAPKGGHFHADGTFHAEDHK